MSIGYQSVSYQGGSPDIPDVDKDFYRSTDFIRNFAFQWQQAGRSIKDLYDQFPVLLNGGVVTEGSSVTQINITPTVGYAAHDVKVPIDYSSNPPNLTTETFEGVRVESTQQTDLSISSATLDGATINYVKLLYKEEGTLTRPRLKGTGSYIYEKNEGFEFIINDVTPTNKDIVIAEIVGDGSTFLTITNREVSGIHKLFMSLLFQDDNRISEDPPANSVLYEFTGLSLKDSEGNDAIRANGINYTPVSDSNNPFANRGVLNACANCFIEYAYSWGNKGTFKMWVKPTFALIPSTNKIILDSRSGGAFTHYVLLYYEDSNQKLTFLVEAGSTSNRIRIESDTFTVLGDLQSWHSIVVTFDKDNNDDVDGLGNANFYLDGVKQGGGVEGSKTKSGTGISALNMNSTIIGFLSEQRDINRYINGYEGYFTQFLRIDDWNEDLTNYGNTIIAIPYHRKNKISGINQQLLIDDNTIGAVKGRFDAIDNGAGFIKEILIPIGNWDMNATANFAVPYPSSITREQIIHVSVLISADTGDLYDLNYLTALGSQGGSIRCDSTEFVISRINGGVFDALGFDDTTINRGYIYIKYLYL